MLAVREAHQQGVKIALYADTYGAHRLKDFEPVRDFVNAMLFINQIEAMGCKDLFPNAIACVTGNPRWEEFAFPRFTKADARERLGIAEDRRVIFVAGDVYLGQNMHLFATTIDAVYQNHWEEDTDILLGLHPGDQNSLDLYKTFVIQAGHRPIRLTGKQVNISSPDVLPACDMVVRFTSTMGIQAACLRIPVFDLCSTIAFGGRHPVPGRDPDELAKNGSSIPIFYGSSSELAKKMQEINDSSAILTSLLVSQKEMFPHTDSRGQAIGLMCRALGA